MKKTRNYDNLNFFDLQLALGQVAPGFPKLLDHPRIFLGCAIFNSAMSPTWA